MCSCICCMDSCLKFLIVFYAPNGIRLGQYQAYTDALGIKCMSWSPSGQLLSIGSYDQKIHIMNSLTWKPIIELSHSAPQYVGSLIAYVQCNEEDAGEKSTSFATYDEVPKMPVTSVDSSSKQVRHGVGVVSWSHDSQFIASRNDSMPHSVWIWSAESMTLQSVVVLLGTIKALHWSPTANRVAFCSGDARVYIWAMSGASWIDVPTENFRIMNLMWSQDGKSLVLLGKDSFCCIYL